MIYQVMRLVGSAMLDFARLAGRVFVKVWDFLGDFYTRALRPFVSWTWNQLQRVHNWLVKTFGPVLKQLRGLRDWILRTYDKWFRPIFATIDMLRGVLRLLETFHVPFARAIDQKLADLEARLTAPIRFALTKINEAIGWIDRIVTFDGLFQRLTLIQSMFRYERDTWRVWWTSIHARELEKPKAPPDNSGPAQTPLETSTKARAYVIDHEGPDVARIDEHVADLRLRLARR